MTGAAGGGPTVTVPVWPQRRAGGSAWGLKHGQHLGFQKTAKAPLSNVFLTLIQKMGVETATFRDATGTLTGLV